MTTFLSLDKWITNPPEISTSTKLLRLILEEAQRRHPQFNIDVALADRRPGHDEYPEADPAYAVIEVLQWRKIVHTVQDPHTEFPLSEALRLTNVGREVGNPWYNMLYAILVRNTAIRDH